MDLWLEEINSPVGATLLVHTSTKAGEPLVALDFADCQARMQRLLHKRFGTFSMHSWPTHSRKSEAAGRLAAYFHGDLQDLSDIPYDAGGTEFQQRVWRNLRRIAFGNTCTYGNIAARLSCPNAARAVGRSNSLNPIAIIIPCHRVIGKSGRLTRYAGGLQRKAWLLAHEKSFSRDLSSTYK